MPLSKGPIRRCHSGAFRAKVRHIICFSYDTRVSKFSVGLYRDFRETGILVDFYESLELSLRSQLTESGLYMGMPHLFICFFILQYFFQHCLGTSLYVCFHLSNYVVNHRHLSRELVREFRQRTLLLVKALILQKKA